MKLKHKTKTTVLAGILAGLTTSGFARQNDSPTPYTLPDEAFVTVSGKVVSSTPDSFQLDYGKGSILVEMDDTDVFSEGYVIVPGEKVVVTGQIDADKGETRSIEAGSVYVESLATTYKASSEDEEELAMASVHKEPAEFPNLEVRGTIEKVSGREFTLLTEEGKVTIDTGDMSFNPMTQAGAQSLKVGSIVSVVGPVNNSLFSGEEVRALSIVILKES